MRNTLMAFITVSLALFGMTISSPVRAGELSQAGRAIADKWQNTVVTLEIVAKTHMAMYGEGETEEQRSEVIGTVIDPSGLVVTSLASTDLMSFFTEAMSGMGEMENMKMTSEVTSVKILFSDGKEVPAQIVLRDKDLDLAFIRPLKKLEQPVPALDLAQAGQPGLLDELVVLNRLGTIANRSISLTLTYVKAVVEKPRRFYVFDQNNQDLGTPVFMQDGSLVGMLVLRKLPKGAGQSLNMLSSGILVIGLPAATIANIAKQAPEAEVKK